MESPLAWDNLKVKVAQLYLTLCDPVDCSLLGSSVHGILQARILEGVVVPFPRVFSQPGLEPTSPTLLADSSLSEPPGKPNNTEVGSLSVLEEIFLTQEPGSPALQADSFSAEPLTYCATLDKSLYFSVYQFPVLWLRVRDKVISTNPSQPLPWRKLRL